MDCFIGTKYILVILCILCVISIDSSNAASSTSYNVVKFGAKPDGKSDSTEAFVDAWKSACSSLVPATIYVPKGRYLLNAINFRGPCKRKVTFLNGGTLVAPEDYKVVGNSGFWILFNHVDNLVVSGGKLDAKGVGFWNCRRSGKNCSVGARVRYLSTILWSDRILKKKIFFFNLLNNI